MASSGCAGQAAGLPFHLRTDGCSGLSPRPGGADCPNGHRGHRRGVDAWGAPLPHVEVLASHVMVLGLGHLRVSRPWRAALTCGTGTCVPEPLKDSFHPVRTSEHSYVWAKKWAFPETAPVSRQTFLWPQDSQLACGSVASMTRSECVLGCFPRTTVSGEKSVPHWAPWPQPHHLPSKGSPGPALFRSGSLRGLWPTPPQAGSQSGANPSR